MDFLVACLLGCIVIIKDSIRGILFCTDWGKAGNTITFHSNIRDELQFQRGRQIGIVINVKTEFT